MMWQQLHIFSFVCDIFILFVCHISVSLCFFQCRVQRSNNCILFCLFDRCMSVLLCSSKSNSKCRVQPRVRQSKGQLHSLLSLHSRLASDDTSLRDRPRTKDQRTGLFKQSVCLFALLQTSVSVRAQMEHRFCIQLCLFVIAQTLTPGPNKDTSWVGQGQDWVWGQVCMALVWQ